MASPNAPDYIAVLTANMKASKDEIQKKFKSIKENLDVKERTIINQLDGIFSENMKSIIELKNCRTQTLESKATLSKTMQNSNHLESLYQNFDSTLGSLNSQLENLTSIKFSWNFPNNLWENLIRIDAKATDLRIDTRVTEGKGTGKLSGDLKGMKVYKEKIYIADSEANAIKIFTRNGEMLDSYIHSKLTNPGSMTIHRNYLYVIAYWKLFKISTIDLETLSIVRHGTTGHVVIDNYEESNYIMSANGQNFVIDCWNSYMLRDKQIKLISPHIVKTHTSRWHCYQPKLSFHDMKIFNDVIYVLFKDSIYPLQTFDLKGRLLNVILEEDLTHNLVGICLTLNTIILRDESNSQILIFSNQGKLIRTIESEDTPFGLESLMCMDVDERDNLVVCDGKYNWKLQDLSI